MSVDGSSKETETEVEHKRRMFILKEREGGREREREGEVERERKKMSKVNTNPSLISPPTSPSLYPLSHIQSFALFPSPYPLPLPPPSHKKKFLSFPLTFSFQRWRSLGWPRPLTRSRLRSYQRTQSHGGWMSSYGERERK